MSPPRYNITGKVSDSKAAAGETVDVRFWNESGSILWNAIILIKTTYFYIHIFTGNTILGCSATEFESKVETETIDAYLADLDLTRTFKIRIKGKVEEDGNYVLTATFINRE